MKAKLKIIFWLLCDLLFFVNGYSAVKLPRLVSDGMILQRNISPEIWGWASAGEKVTIEFNRKSYHTTAGADGKWSISLSPLEAGGPYKMEIIARNKIELNDILVGDVWVCSGQSNMDLPMRRVADHYAEVIANSENPAIRRFFVSTQFDFKKPHEDLPSGRWESANPETIPGFTATGYFFAKALYEKYQVPIGLIHASVGGSPAEAWLSEEALQAFPIHLEEAIKFKDSAYVQQIFEHDRVVSRAWYQLLRQRDLGYANPEMPWYSPEYDASDWAIMALPGYWAESESGPVNGVFWFRKEIDVSDSITGKPARLNLGTIIDSDSVYINGIFVGKTSYRYPPRRYSVPANVLKSGKNIIVVRVISNSGQGGFILEKPYEILAGNGRIDLTGDWRYKLGATMEPLPEPTFVRWKPVGLYNAMIAPLLKYKIKGVIWYQGESNAGRAKEYRTLFPAVIADWRKKWQLGEFPYLFVQLANYMEANSEPSESGWAELREAQLHTLAVPNTGMAVAIDIGEWNDIHPENKADVGKRLALAAQCVAYGDSAVVYSGPIYDSMEITGNQIVISFKHVGSGLIAKGGGELHQFAIAGADKKFVWAKAKIKDDKVVVWSENVNAPVAVRYAWADNPEGANLYNQEDLPASPFRTDSE